MASTTPSSVSALDATPLTERQKRRRAEKTIMKKPFAGNITINSDSDSGGTTGQHDDSDASDKASRMFIWSSSVTRDGVSGLGIITWTNLKPEPYVRNAYRVMRTIDALAADFLAVAMALKIAKDECVKLRSTNMQVPTQVLICSNSRDALLRMRELNFIMPSGLIMPDAAVRIVTDSRMAAHFMTSLGVNVELRWVTRECDNGDASEAAQAASEAVKYKPPSKGPDAFVKDVQEILKRKTKAQMQRRSKRQRSDANTADEELG